MKNNTNKYKHTLVFETAATQDTMAVLTAHCIVDVKERHSGMNNEVTKLEYEATNTEHKNIVDVLKDIKFTIFESIPHGNRKALLIRL